MSKSLVLQKVLLMNQKQHRLPMNPVFFESLEYNWKMLFLFGNEGVSNYRNSRYLTMKLQANSHLVANTKIPYIFHDFCGVHAHLF